MGSTIIHSRLMLRFVQCAGRVGSMGGSTSAKSRPTRIMMTGLRIIHMASRLNIEAWIARLNRTQATEAAILEAARSCSEDFGKAQPNRARQTNREPSPRVGPARALLLGERTASGRFLQRE